MTTWAATSSLIQARARHALFSFGDYVYAGGGMSDVSSNGSVLASIEKAQKQANKSLAAWATEGNALTAARQGMGVAVHLSTGRAYFVGGINGSGITVTTVDHGLIGGSGVIGTIATTTVLPAARNFPCAFFGSGAGADTLYVLGGYSGSGSLATTAYRSAINTGSGAAGSWSTGATAFPIGLRAHLAFLSGTTVYVLAGAQDTSSTTASGSSLVYSGTATGGDIAWTLEERLAVPPMSLTSVVFAGILAFGGTEAFLHHLDILQAATPGGVWQATSVTPPAMVANVRGTLYEDTIYVVGGTPIAATGTVTNAATSACYYGAPLVVGDEVAPTITNVSPINNSTLGRYTPATFRIQSTLPDALGLVTVHLKYSDVVETYTVYKGSLVAPFDTRSTVTDVDSDGRKLDFSLLPVGGWKGPIEISWSAGDYHGVVGT